MNAPTDTQPLAPFARFASIFRRDIPTFRDEARIERVNHVLCTLISLPLAVLGVAWLARESDWTLVLQNWTLLPLVIALIILLSRWNFFLIADLGARGGGMYGNVNSSIDSVIRWSAVFFDGADCIVVRRAGRTRIAGGPRRQSPHHRRPQLAIRPGFHIHHRRADPRAAGGLLCLYRLGRNLSDFRHQPGKLPAWRGRDGDSTRP